MSDKSKEIPQKDSEFYVALGWLSAVSVSISSLLTFG
jgi:hypothetical protein